MAPDHAGRLCSGGRRVDTRRRGVFDPTRIPPERTHERLNAIDLPHVPGVAEPNVAILAAVETVNPEIPSTLEAAALCKMANRG